MAVQFYLLPIERVTVEGVDYRGPKYLKWRMNPGGLAVPWSMKDYGVIDWGVVAVDADAATHTTLAGYADAYQFPANLDAKPSANIRNAIRGRLEGFNAPGGWITNQDTYRSILRTVTGLFLFMCQLSERWGNPFVKGYNLNTAYGDLPADGQAVVVEEAARLGYTDAIPAATTLRTILKLMADAWAAKPILFGLVTL